MKPGIIYLTLLRIGKDSISVLFISGDLRNDIRSDKSFLYVERLSNDHWSVVATDTDIETKIYWIRTNSLLNYSNVRITWEIPIDTSPGTYRVRHVGSYKYWLNGEIYEYEGKTKSFEVK